MGASKGLIGSVLGIIQGASSGLGFMHPASSSRQGQLVGLQQLRRVNACKRYLQALPASATCIGYLQALPGKDASKQCSGVTATYGPMHIAKDAFRD
jgi:hypothetical protein